MKTLFHLLAIMVLVIAPGLVARPAIADDPAAASPGQQLQQGGALIRQGLEKVMGSIAASLRAIPQYALPKLDENGNIILRRTPPRDGGAQEFGDRNAPGSEKDGSI